MKLLASWAVSAGLLVAAFPAQAQMSAPADAGRSPYRAASDLEEPYEPPPPAAPSYAPYPPNPYVPPPYAPYPPNSYAPAPYAYEPAVMPPREVYALLRENGFVPLGIPHREGFVYSISAIDPDGEDGRLLIDARTGRILRFMPAYSWGGRSDASPLSGRYAAETAPAAPRMVHGIPRPPAAVPHVASRSVPLPAPKPIAARPADSTPPRAAVQKPAQSAAAQVQTGAPTAPAAAGQAGETKPPAPAIRPTEPMPQVQGLE